MYLSITNHNHEKIKYYVVDTTKELNFPNIPNGYTLIFKEKYTSKLEKITPEKFEKIFENNTLFYDIKLFNNIYKCNESEFKIQINNCINEFNSNIVTFNDSFNILIGNDLIEFNGISDEYYTSIEIDNKLNELNSNLELLENKISSLNEISKKEEIENELQILEDKIISLIS